MTGQRPHLRGGPMREERRARRSLILLITVSLCLALFVSGCSKKKEEAKAEKINNVKVWVTEKRSVRPYIDTIGTLNPNDEVVISSEVDGILREIKVDEGSGVVKGTVLARVDDTDYRLTTANADAAIKQAEANLDNLKIEFKRKEALLKEELVTKQQFDDISTRLAVATHDLERAKLARSLVSERLGKTVISSPLKGIVKEKKMSVGDFVRAGMPLMTIVQIDPLKLSFTVTEKDSGTLKKGQDIIFGVDPYPGREFTGTLSIIYPNLDERTRSLKAEALVQNPSLELKPGFFARVKIYTGASKQAVVVPVTSILYEGTQVRVFLSEGKVAKERQIKVGAKYGELVEVLQGLNGGETLIIVGQNNLTNGVRINVVK